VQDPFSIELPNERSREKQCWKIHGKNGSILLDTIVAAEGRKCRNKWLI